jgi:hypothetical protein
MRTRSQSKALENTQDPYINYDNTIDFDDASRCWMANKKALPNGCYKYICGKELQFGSRCQNKPNNKNMYCHLHK